MAGRRRVVVAASGASGAGARTERGRRRSRTSTKAIVYAIAGLIVLIPGCALAFYFVEHGHNEQVMSVGSAFRWASLTLLEDQSPFDANTDAGTVIVSDDMTGALIANSAMTHGLSRVVADLMTHAEGNEFKVMAVPAALISLPFAEAVGRLKRSANCVLFAVAIGDGDFEINPDAERPLGHNDRLLVIAPGASAPRRASSSGRSG